MAASAFGARPMCRVAGPTAATGVEAETWWWSATRRKRDLASLHRARHFRAGRGAHGRGKQQHGARGEDRPILVPPGTQVEGLERPQLRPRRARPARRGRRRGRSAATATSASRAPPARRPVSPSAGLAGESGWIELRLKLLADAGLVGQPNAGQVVASATADAGRAEGGRLPVHDPRAGARHARVRGAPAGPGRHPRPDRRCRAGRRARPRVPRPPGALRRARPPGRHRRRGPRGGARDGAGRAAHLRRRAGALA